jgi:hypothetical protein
MSAAVDLVDKSILIDKLKLYGLDEGSSSWIKSYMSERNQRVFLDGELSDALQVEVGVSQQSILAPILYCLIVNKLQEVPHNHLPEAIHPTFWNNYCSNCGGMSCFTDDSSFSKSDKDPGPLNHDINEKYLEISEYMAAKKLVLNSDKTHLLAQATRQLWGAAGHWGRNNQTTG